MKTFEYDDGGRAKAGYKGTTGDCVVRAIAIATELPYQKIYNDLFKIARSLSNHKEFRNRNLSPRSGVSRKVYQQYLESLGWEWIPTMQIGSGCKVHLHKDELPSGRLIVRLSRHITTVINGVIHDTYNPQRGSVIYSDGRIVKESRCVYGYFRKIESNYDRIS